MHFDSFKWMNESRANIDGDGVTIFAPDGTDFFNTPITENGKSIHSQTNAPFFYQEIDGDFIFRALLNPTHKELFDAASLMVFQNSHLWVKAGYEKTENDVRRLLSVVTDPFSDDANGPILDVSDVWMQIARKSNTLAVHYSLDGKRYDMLRVCRLPFRNILKVGFCAQCATGEGVFQTFRKVLIEKQTITDIWSGQ